MYAYDAKGRQISAKDPDKGTTLSEYNNYSELVKTTDARGEVLFYVYDQIGRKIELRDDSATGALRAEWKYDTLYSGQTGFRSHLTQTIRYEPAGTANAYKWQVRQMDGRYQPTGINIVIPAAETGLAATYIAGSSYSSFNGQPTGVFYGAVADLPAEDVTIDYDSATGLPVRLDTNRTGENGTMLSTWYTAFGEQSLTTRKMPGGVYVDDTVEYDTYNRRVKRTTIKPETAAGTVSDRNYEHDPAGNPILIDEKPQIGGRDIQCFRYDRLARLEIGSVGATNQRSFDAWVDGVRSEFKTPTKDRWQTAQHNFAGADGQNAERLYIYSKNISAQSVEDGRKAHLNNKTGKSGTDYKYYQVIEMDLDGVNQWSTDLTPITEPVDCSGGWDWLVC